MGKTYSDMFPLSPSNCIVIAYHFSFPVLTWGKGEVLALFHYNLVPCLQYVIVYCRQNHKRGVLISIISVAGCYSGLLLLNFTPWVPKLSLLCASHSQELCSVGQALGGVLQMTQSISEECMAEAATTWGQKHWEGSGCVSLIPGSLERASWGFLPCREWR